MIKKKFPFLVAEISANHNGSFSNAKKLILTAKKCGADAVKLQTYSPETMTIKSNNKYFKINKGLWKGINLWDLYSKAQTPYKWHKDLFDYAKKIGILCFSTPYDETAVDFLENLKCPIYKVASFEINDLELIKKISKTGKPIIISTGMANLNQIKKAYNCAKRNGAKDIALLYCVSIYPAKENDFNINNIKILKENFNCTIGFSDHSNNDLIAMSAVAAGAEIVEKHIALDKQKKGFDIEFSIKGNRLKKFKENISKTKMIMGKENFVRSNSENFNKRFRRSIFCIKNIKKGEIFTKKNIKKIRPGFGVLPSYYSNLLNKKSPENISAGNPIKKNILIELRIKQN